MGTSDYYKEGLSREELMQVGERKLSHDLPISATDINTALPYAVAQEKIAGMQGLTNDDYKVIGERKMRGLPGIAASDINAPRMNMNELLNNALDNLNSFLQFRLK